MPNVNVIALLGTAFVAVGFGAQFGWPAGLIAAGACLLLGELLGGRR